MPHGSPPARGPRVQAPFLARRRGPRTKAPTDHGGWWPWGSGAENPSSPGDPPPALFLYTAWKHSKGNILYIASAVSLASRFRSRDLSGVSFPFMAAEQSAVLPENLPPPRPPTEPPGLVAQLRRTPGSCDLGGGGGRAGVPRGRRGHWGHRPHPRAPPPHQPLDWCPKGGKWGFLRSSKGSPEGSGLPVLWDTEQFCNQPNNQTPILFPRRLETRSSSMLLQPAFLSTPRNIT